MMAERDWTDAGHGWQGKATMLRLVGWSRQRRVVLLRRKLDRPLVLVDRTQPEQPLLSFAEIGPNRNVWKHPAQVTSLDAEILTLGQLLPRSGRLRELVRRTEAGGVSGGENPCIDGDVAHVDGIVVLLRRGCRRARGRQGRCAPLRGGLRPSLTAAARVGAGMRRSGRRDGRLDRTTG